MIRRSSRLAIYQPRWSLKLRYLFSNISATAIFHTFYSFFFFSSFTYSSFLHVCFSFSSHPVPKPLIDFLPKVCSIKSIFNVFFYILVFPFQLHFRYGIFFSFYFPACCLSQNFHSRTLNLTISSQSCVVIIIFFLISLLLHI